MKLKSHHTDRLFRCFDSLATVRLSLEPKRARRRFSRLLATAAAGVLLLAGTAAHAQGPYNIDRSDPAAVEQMNAAMEDAFEDMPFGIDAEGMTAGEGLFGAMFGPSVTQADFDGFVKTLKFESDQTMAARSIYKQRTANYQNKAGLLQRMIADFISKGMKAAGRGEQPDMDGEDKLMVIVKEVEVERVAMSTGVMEDLKALLSKEQEALWPKVEQSQRRNRLMRFQSLLMAAGARVDVPRVIERTLAVPGTEKPTAEDSERISQALAEYETIVDAIAKQAIPLDDDMRTMNYMGSKATPEQMQKQMQMAAEGGAMADRVRTANEAAIRTTAAVLAEPVRATLWENFNREAYPNVYRETHGQRVIDAALKFKDLTDDQREKLTTMKTNHAAKLDGLKPKVVAQMIAQNQTQSEWMAAKDEEAKTKAHEKMIKAITEDNSKADLKAADGLVVKQVRELMNEEQRAKLPKRPKPKVPFEIEVETPGQK